MNCVPVIKPITRNAAAEILDVSVRTLENWGDEEIMPKPGAIGGRAYWLPDVFYGWLRLKLTGRAMESGPAEPFKPVTREAAAAIFDVNVRTITNWIDAGTMPVPAEIGGRRYWHPDVFNEWVRCKLTGQQWTVAHGAELDAEQGGAPAPARFSKQVAGASKTSRKARETTSGARARARDAALLDAIQGKGLSIGSFAGT